MVRASEGGHIEIARALIAAGADVNVQDQSGKTAFVWAVEGGHTEIADALIADAPFELFI